jgi:hypothetical protein
LLTFGALSSVKPVGQADTVLRPPFVPRPPSPKGNAITTAARSKHRILPRPPVLPALPTLLFCTSHPPSLPGPPRWPCITQVPFACTVRLDLVVRSFASGCDLQAGVVVFDATSGLHAQERSLNWNKSLVCDFACVSWLVCWLVWCRKWKTLVWWCVAGRFCLPGWIKGWIISHRLLTLDLL